MKHTKCQKNKIVINALPLVVNKIFIFIKKTYNLKRSKYLIVYDNNLNSWLSFFLKRSVDNNNENVYS